MSHDRHQPDYEGLQVVPTDGLEHNGFTPGLEVAPAVGMEYYAAKSADTSSYPEVVCESKSYPKAAEANIYPDNHPEAVPAAAKPICGLRWRTFWIVLGVAVLTVIIAAVLGGVLASKNSAEAADSTPIPVGSGSISISSASRTTASSSSSDSSTSPPTFTAQIAYPTTRLPLACPSINESTAQVTGRTGSTYDFDITCSANFGPGRDVAVMNTSSVADCMQNCADRVALGSNCVGVVWDAIMNLALSPRKNCFLKGSTADFEILDVADDISVAALMVQT